MLKDTDGNVVGVLSSAHDITDQKKVETEIHRHTEETAALLQTSLALTDLDLQTTMTTVGERASALFKADACRIFLTEETDSESLRCALALGENQAVLLGLQLKFGEGVTGNIAARGQAEIVNDMQNDPRAIQIAGTPEEEEAIMFAPLKSGERVIGIMSVKRLGRERPFSPSDLDLLKAFAAMSASAVSNARLFELTRQRVSELDTLHRASQMLLGAHLDPDMVYTTLHQAVAQVMPSEVFSIVLDDENGGDYHAVYLYDVDQGYPSRRIPRGQGLSGKVISEGKTLFIHDNLQTNMPAVHFGSPKQVRSILAVPLRKKNEVVGMVSAQSYQPNVYGEWHRILLETLAAQITTIIENAQLFEHLQSANTELALAYDATIEGWSRAVDLRDQDTEGHTQRVTEMAVTLARAIGMQAKELLNLRRSALLHDIGKIGVPDHILLKPGKLTKQEWEIMRKHPQFAYEMLLPIKYLHQALDIPYGHHEKWDGTGYPRGLKGEQIPLAARIFAIVDVYDALTSDRPYRKAWTKAKTLKHIREQSGTHLDPQIVEKFMDLWEKKRLKPKNRLTR